MKIILIFIFSIFVLSINAQQLTNAEYFFDTDPGIGNGTSLTITSGDDITNTFNIVTTGLTEGFHNLFIRYKDDNNVWSIYEGRTFYIHPEITNTPTATITATEYFFDTDPGIGNGTAISITSGDDITNTFNIVTTGLPEGFHNLFIRYKDENNVWSIYEGRAFYIHPDIVNIPAATITAMEYFIDTDPGVGNGTAISITSGDDITENVSANTAGFSYGSHYLYIRVKDANGIWSISERDTFEITCNSSNTINPSACDTYISPSGNYTWTNSGIYNDTIPNTAGCDSVLTINLTINPTYDLTENESICSGEDYTFPDGTTQTNITSQVIYTSNLQTIFGCDSIIETTVNINPVYDLQEIYVICYGSDYTFPDGTSQTNIITQVIYTSNLLTVLGCDSIIETTLTIETESPVITSTHNDLDIDANANCEAILPDYTGDVTATDNCDTNLDVTQNPVAGTTISGVTNQITLTVTDDAGNSADVSFNLEVEDVSDPVITSTHNDQTIDADANCEASVPDYTGDVTATDNCDTNLDVTQNPAAGTTISGVTNQVTLTVTDDAGNSTDVTFNIEVEDNTDPIITCVDNQIINLEEGQTSYTVQGIEFDPVSTDDNCSIASIINDYNASSTLDGAVLPIETTTIIWTVEDDASNSNTCSFDVTVNEYVNIKDLSESGIYIYPNPSSGVFSISTTDRYIITVSDITGKVLKQISINDNQISIDLSNESNGTYFIKFSNNKTVKIAKIIKK